MTALRRRTAPPDEQALWMLLRRQVWRYTQGDHESIPVEIADGLLQSTLYTLRRAEDAQGSLEARFEEGQRRLRRDVQKARLLLEEARATALRFDNWSYRDTLAGIGGFFREYNIEFAAQETPCDIDYQLSDPVPQELSGVAYIAEYLRRMVLENRFVGRFAPERVAALLRAGCPDAQGLLINLFEPVFQNALGNILLGKPPRMLVITAGERAGLLAHPPDPPALEQAAQALCGQLDLGEASMAPYLRGAAARLWPRLAQALGSGDLSPVFPSLEGAQEDQAGFVDGARMPDGKLRALAQALRPLDTGPKVDLLRKEVRSLADLADLLSDCFYQEEALAVFPLLSPAEREALLAHAREDGPDWLGLLRRFMGEKVQTKTGKRPENTK